jgi:hypothetical protein
MKPGDSVRLDVVLTTERLHIAVSDTGPGFDMPAPVATADGGLGLVLVQHCPTVGAWFATR